MGMSKARESIEKANETQEESWKKIEEAFASQAQSVGEQRAEKDFFYDAMMDQIRDYPEYFPSELTDTFVQILGEDAEALDKILSDDAAAIDQLTKKLGADVVGDVKDYITNANEAFQSGGKDMLQSYSKVMSEGQAGMDSLAGFVEGQSRQAQQNFDEKTGEAVEGLKDSASQATQALAAVKGLYETQGAEALTNYNQGAQGIADVYAQGGDAVKAGYEAALTGTKEGTKKIEQTAGAGVNKGLERYREMAARKELPGQSVMEAQAAGKTQEALRNIREMGGGSAQSLSALSKAYQAEQGALRDIGVAGAQQQRQAQMNLAGAETQAGYGMADIQAQNLAAQTAAQQQAGQAGLTGAQTTARGQQYATEAGYTGAQTQMGNIGQSQRDMAQQAMYGGQAVSGAQMSQAAQLAQMEQNRISQVAGYGSQGVGMAYDAGMQRAAAQGQLGQGQADLYMQQAGMMPGIYGNLYGQQLQGTMAASGMRATGQQALSGANMQAYGALKGEESMMYNQNQLAPWSAAMGVYGGGYGGLSPYESQANLNSAQASLGWQNYNLQQAIKNNWADTAMEMGAMINESNQSAAEALTGMFGGM